jgi:hypothetical protein
MTRRDFLSDSGGGLGSIAFAAMLGREKLSAADGPAKRADGGLHHAPKAKRVVHLFMDGGASHLDLFDYKPELVKRHCQPARFGETVEVIHDGLGPWLKPLWEFRPNGKSGRIFLGTAAPLDEVADHLAFVHNVVVKADVHSQCTLLPNL